MESDEEPMPVHPQISKIYLDLEETKKKNRIQNFSSADHQNEVSKRLYMEDQRREARRELQRLISEGNDESAFPHPFKQNDFDAFIVEQNEFLKKKEEFYDRVNSYLIQERKAKELDEVKGLTFTPKINKKSRQLSSKSHYSPSQSQGRHKFCFNGDELLTSVIKGFLNYLKAADINFTTDPINYLGFSDILRDLEIIHQRFIKDERRLVYDFWVLLRGNINRSVFAFEILSFIILLQGYKLSQINSLKINETGLNVKQFDIFKNYINSEAYKRLKGNFTELRRKVNFAKESISDYQRTHSSSSNRKEKQSPANKYRAKVINEASNPNKIKNVEDYLILKKEIEDKKLEYKRARKIEEELKDCTFKPIINHYQSNILNTSSYSGQKSHSHATTIPLGELRNSYLYELSKHLSKRKSLEALEECEKKELNQMKECTFYPKTNSKPITPYKTRCLTSNSHSFPINQDKVYYVPRKGQKGKEILSMKNVNIRDKNYIKGNSKKRVKSSSKKPLQEINNKILRKERVKARQIPSNQILIVNLKISNGNYEKVRFNRSDDPQKIIKQFAIKHSTIHQ